MTRKTTSILITIPEDEFYDRMRMIIREEIKLASQDSKPGSVYDVDGLTCNPLYNMKEVQRLFRGVSRTTIYEWIKAGILRRKKMKGKVYFLWEDIRRQLDKLESGD